MAAGTDYDAQLREVTSGRRVDRRRLLGPRHHRHRARGRPAAAVYDQLDGTDGFVSIEVSPNLAHDTDGTIAQAKELWDRLAKPNVMIKIPATSEGSRRSRPASRPASTSTSR